jgi:hypothetical protein
MILCQKCNRLYRESACPFCCGVTRRELGMIAAALVVAPMAVAGQDAKPAYGVARPPEPIDKVVETIDPTHEGWLEEVGLVNPVSSWASHAPGTKAILLVSGQEAKRATTALLLKVDKEAVTIRIEGARRMPNERKLAVGTGITEDAKVTDDGKETMELGDRTFECDVKSYEMPGRTFKVWHCKEAPLGTVKIVCGEETTRLVKAKESMTVKAGSYDCSLWETKGPSGTRRTWRSEKMPGLTVKAEITQKIDGVEAKYKIEAQSVVEGK